ncbi:hypothetical protein NP493_362g02025 [Ridgeia piscesae]|uniref:Uncharacterized protein n=1 Tax=Ridgeia piscesae TaxID=27915 RepID=A0AAD9L422_RIDPI|nr:hypothetical protein NP493_362g02025 [Ridgeia piscesae]
MDNMKPLIDAVSGDRREEAATDDEAGRPDCRGASQGGQRGSSCGRYGRSGPPHWVGMMSYIDPPWGSSWGPPCEPCSGQPCRPSYGPSCGRRCGPRCGQPNGPPFMYGPSGYRHSQCPWSAGPSFMHGPPAHGPMACPWSAGPSFMHGPPANGPMACSWGTHPQWAAELIDDEGDEEHAGKENAKDAGKETPDPEKREDGAGEEKSGQQCTRCPWVDRMRPRRLRHGNVDCRRHDPCPMYRRCRRGFGARSHCHRWATVPGDCCQPGARMGWGKCPYPPPFFCPDASDSAGESNSDPENDNQKQTPDIYIYISSRPFYQGPLRFGDCWRQGCHGNGRGWRCGPPRNKLYQMLSWKRKVLKEKLQRIESHLERLRPSEDGAKEATMSEDLGPEQALSMDTYVEDRAERGWEVIADSE